MSDATDTWETLAKKTKAMPKDADVYCDLYRVTEDGSLSRIGSIKPLDRDLDLFGQVEAFLAKKKLRGTVKTKIMVRPEGGPTGTVSIEMPAAEIAPAPIESEVRKENPGKAEDPMDGYRKGHAAYTELGRMFGPKCEQCKAWVEECKCPPEEDELCEECGLSDDDCECEAEPSLGDALAKKFLLDPESGILDDLVDGVNDVVRSTARRIRYGVEKAPPAPTVTGVPLKVVPKSDSGMTPSTNAPTNKTGGT